MKHRLLALFTVLFAISIIATPFASAKDIDQHWAKKQMTYLIENEILSGDPDGSYRPDDSITRAEFATLLVKVLELPSVSTPSKFHDVKSSDWFYDAINRASYHEIVKGDPNGYFNPKSQISRQEMAVMLKRAMDYKGITITPQALTFIDRNKIASWAESSIQHVVAFKLINGYPNNTFLPLGNTTRAEASTVLYFFLKPEEKPVDEPIVTEIVYKETQYNRNFSDVITLQANNSPKVDGAGKFIATAPLVAYYLNPSNFAVNSPEYYQFLKLSTAVTNLDANVINEKYLYNKGILKGTANSFIEAGLTHDINAIYLISHALHETNNGKSNLATGIEVGININGTPEMVTDKNRSDLANIKTTYNFYGIGAIDSNPNKYGAERAYSEGWLTVHDAIIGGAEFVKEKYIGVGQDTLYKMRWNPDNPPTHQYATHVMWSIIQARKIHEIYAITGANETTQLVFDVPKYVNQPATSPLPSPEAQYALLPAWQGGIGAINSTDGNVNLRTYPVTGISTNIVTKLAHGTKLSVVGSNGDWYKVIANGSEGWVSSVYVKLTNLLKVVDMKEYAIKSVNVRSEPNTSSTIIGSVNANADVVGVVDASGNFVKDGQWFKVIVNGKTGWIRGDYIVQETTQPADGQ